MVRQAPWQPDIYVAPFLAIYDWYVLGFMNRFVWHCPTSALLALYDAHDSGHHLDVGVGTGYYLDKCRFPTSSPELVLLDRSVHPLRWAARRLGRYRPRVRAASILEPIDLGGERFDSIGLNYVVHCLPGDLRAKSEAFRHLRALLNPGGVMFGGTLLGQGVRQNLLAHCFRLSANRLGVFGNRRDDLAGLDRELRAHFTTVEIEVIGCVALFVACA
jgi:SAM-dependent methyltransferase